jgi:GTP-binding protein HflX
MSDEQLNLDISQGKAVIVGVQLNGEDADKISEDLDELESLLATLGVEVERRIIQKRHKLTAATLLGTGKVEEIKDFAEAYHADLVVFDRALTPPQVRNLEKMTNRRVMDRTGVILEIFSRHARTNQAKTQVEIARLEYILPRLSGAWTHFQRQTGGSVRSRGMGEKQIEVDRRRARERIARLQRQLEQIRKDKAVQRRARANELQVALVGYTNSGKTTLMKGLTRANVEAKDELFATLDTNVKTLDPRTRPKILLSDTVGFIRNLPHSLVESFKSTLDEVLEADLLLNVVDVSHSNYQDHLKITHQVLDEIGAGDIPQIVIFNKADQLEDPVLPRVLRAAHPDSQVISARNLDDVLALREYIFQFFLRHFVNYELVIDVGDQATQSQVFQRCMILETNYEQSGVVRFKVQSSREVYEKLKKYVVPDQQVNEDQLKE